MPELDEIRAHAVKTLTTEGRLEVGRAANGVVQVAEEIIACVKPVYEAAQKGDWPEVFLALLLADQKVERYTDAVKTFRDCAHRALTYEKRHPEDT